jgi:uroporphyrinogen decarboxylase
MESKLDEQAESNPTDAAGFKGLAVVAFESRMATEMAALIERFGGRPIVAPAMREVALEDNRAALEFGAGLLAGAFDIVIFLTGVGVRELFRVMETRYERAALVAALARMITVARGPKPVIALRELGLAPSVVIPEPNTWHEVLAALTGRLAERSVALQEYGTSNQDLIAGLEARGARVTRVPVYRWTLPIDRAPLIAAVRRIAAGEVAAILFTSASQVINVFQIAQAEGLAAELAEGLARGVVASIGPVCSEQLRAYGVAPDIEPAHSKLGHLVKETAARCYQVLASKRRAPAAVMTVESPTPREIHRVGDAETALADHPLMRACRREPVPFTPVWLMRQAGRYMPEYRRVRERYSFLEMCRRPEVAAEVTVTAVERLGVDAAIIFADILLPIVPMGVGLQYEKGDGPIIERPIRTLADIERIPSFATADELGFVADSIRLARRALNGLVPLIGFAGAPFTLASYLIEGGGSRQYQATKTLMYNQPAAWHRLMELLARVTADYLNMQVDAGADLVQLFDSWVGSLGPDDYRRFVLPYTRSVIAAVGSVPVIHFGTVTGNLLEMMREAGSDVIGLDWRVDLAEAWARLGHDVAVQGNLDPVALFADRAEIRRRARGILDAAAGRPGHIFNLGHGILPETPVDNVIALVDAVHEMSRR